MNYSYRSLKKLLLKSNEFPRITKVAQANISGKRRRDESHNRDERVLRTLSWLHATEKARNINTRLTNTLIAFNALYAHPVRTSVLSSDKNPKPLADAEMANSFIDNLIERDKKGILLDFLIKERHKINAIMRNRYLFADYWGTYMGAHQAPQKCNWKIEFNQENDAVKKLLARKPKDGEPGRKKMEHALKTLLKRIRVLRNQMMHGAAGHNDHYSHWQVNLCAKFMLSFVKCMLYIVIENPTGWGKVPYPPQAKPDARTSSPKPLKGN